MTLRHEVGRASKVMMIGSATMAIATHAFAQEVGMRPGGAMVAAAPS